MNNENINDLLYGFGSFIYYNLLRAKYLSFKEEMLKHIQIETWKEKYEDSQKLMNSNLAKKLISKKHFYITLRKQHIQIGDILAIKFYTDLDDEQQEFRRSFRKQQDTDTDKDIIDRHINGEIMQLLFMERNA